MGIQVIDSRRYTPEGKGNRFSHNGSGKLRNSKQEQT